MRAPWTKAIVGAGRQVGLTFNEDWREEDVQAGPLPALFLRETAVSLEKNPVRLSLYLGSDYPIKPANKFTAAQMEKFQGIRKTGKPQFFFEQDTGLHTAMFSDIAVVDACIHCHNKHKESPKSDWKLGDVMGATTWSYPEDAVTLAELIKILAALRQGFREAYTAYLTKVETFAKRPPIGDKWPRDGFYLPTVDVFMGEALKRASSVTLASVLTAFQPKEVVASANNTPSEPKAVLAVATPISTKTPAVTDPQTNAAYETPPPQSDVIKAAVKTQRVGALPAQAERQMAAKQLTTPVGDAAFESYEHALKLIPGHEEALEGIARIKGEYKLWAEADKRRGNWKRAEANLEKALVIDPKDPTLPVALHELREAQKRADKEAAREQESRRLARGEGQSLSESPATAEQGLRALPSHEGSRSSPGDARSEGTMAHPVSRFEEFERRIGDPIAFAGLGPTMPTPWHCTRRRRAESRSSSPEASDSSMPYWLKKPE